MIMSPDSGNTNMAMEILNNRDKDNKESEAQYNKLMSLIVKDKELFPSSDIWVIKIKGKILSVRNGPAFSSEAEAKKWLSWHLTDRIGTEGSNRGLNSPYLKAIKTIFKSGIKMRDFLVKNNLVSIEKIS
jgi:hypothetical protein